MSSSVKYNAATNELWSARMKTITEQYNYHSCL